MIFGSQKAERLLDQSSLSMSFPTTCATRAGQLRYARLLPDLISSSSADEVAPLRAGPDR